MRPSTASGGNASSSTLSATAYSAQMLGTSASQGECSPIAPARVLDSTISVYALSYQRLCPGRGVGPERMLCRCAVSSGPVFGSGRGVLGDAEGEDGRV